MFDIMFAGSAKATAAMKQYTKRAVLRAIETKKMIAFGDNPSGVDMMALVTCLEADYKHFSIFTLRQEMARSLHVASEYPNLITKLPSKGTYEQYHARDRQMIDLSESCMFIWNGKSLGTQQGYEYAVSLGKHCWMVNFSSGTPVIINHEGEMKEIA